MSRRLQPQIFEHVRGWVLIVQEDRRLGEENAPSEKDGEGSNGGTCASKEGVQASSGGERESKRKKRKARDAKTFLFVR